MALPGGAAPGEAAELDPDAPEDSAAAADRPEGADQAGPAEVLPSGEGAA